MIDCVLLQKLQKLRGYCNQRLFKEFINHNVFGLPSVFCSGNLVLSATFESSNTMGLTAGINAYCWQIEGDIRGVAVGFLSIKGAYNLACTNRQLVSSLQSVLDAINRLRKGA